MDLKDIKSKLKEAKKDIDDQISFLESIEKSKNFKIVKFGAEWCTPCVSLKPYFKKSKEENPEIDFYDLDIGTKDTQKNLLLLPIHGLL